MIRLMLAVAFVIVAACTSNPPPTRSAPPSAPAGLDPDHVLIAVTDASGWPGIDATRDSRIATLTADGTVIARAPANVILPTVSRDLDAVGLDEAWAALAGRGLAVDRSLALDGLFDASTTKIRIDDGVRATELAIYGLGSDAAVGSFPPEEAVLRANAANGIRELQLLAGGEPWLPPALLLLWSPYEEAPSGVQPRVVDWTAPVDLATAGSPVNDPVISRCAVVDGEVAAAVAALASTVPLDIVVEQEALRYLFTVRPIYPDELGQVDCP